MCEREREKERALYRVKSVPCLLGLTTPPSTLHPQVLIHDGHRAAGREPIIAKLRQVAQMNSGFKIVHQVENVDCQPLGVVRSVKRGEGRKGFLVCLSLACSLHTHTHTHTHTPHINSSRPPPFQPLQDGSALVHVQGLLKLTGVTGAGNKPMPYTECFILSQMSPGEYYVASQIYRMLA